MPTAIGRLIDERIFDAVEVFHDLVEVVGEVVGPDFDGAFVELCAWERGEGEDVLDEVFDVSSEVACVLFAIALVGDARFVHGCADFGFEEVFERGVDDFDVDFVFAGVDEIFEVALDVAVPESARAHGVDESRVDGFAHEFAFSWACA